MKKVLMFVLGSLMLNFTSCYVPRKVVTTEKDTSVSGNFNSVGISGQLIMVKPLVAELSITNYILDTFAYDRVNTMEFFEVNNAMVLFCNRNGCDVVIHPKYFIKKESIITKVKTYSNSGVPNSIKTTSLKDTIYYSGYCGVYKNIRNYEAKDSLLLPFYVK